MTMRAYARPRMSGGARAGRLGYWVLVAVLLVVGVLGIFSIGLPFLLTGLVLAALAPMRRDPASFWPPLVGTFAFFLGYILIAPLGCTTTDGQATAREPALTKAGGAPSVDLAVETTVCTNVLGRDYSGSGSYHPPVWPALLTGMFLGGAASLSTRALLRRKLPGSSAG